jgi:hypothetical protein
MQFLRGLRIFSREKLKLREEIKNLHFPAAYQFPGAGKLLRSVFGCSEIEGEA